MKKRLLWPGLVVGVAAVALGAQMLSGLGGNGGPPPAPLTEQVFFEDDVAPAHTPAQYDLTIVIYSDYQCGYCRQLDASMQKLLQEDPRIRVIYRDWPLLGHGSAEAARAAIASQWQGKHAAFHQALMTLPARLTPKTIRMAAEQAGVDWARLEQDLEARKTDINRLLARNAAQAAQLGLAGTPGMLVGRYRVPGALDPQRLREVVRLAREANAADARKTPPA